jgi:hypothetical protein
MATSKPTVALDLDAILARAQRLANPTTAEFSHRCRSSCLLDPSTCEENQQDLLRNRICNDDIPAMVLLIMELSGTISSAPNATNIPRTRGKKQPTPEKRAQLVARARHQDALDCALSQCFGYDGRVATTEEIMMLNEVGYVKEDGRLTADGVRRRRHLLENQEIGNG